MYNVTLPSIESFSMISEKIKNFIDNNIEIEGK